jgi:hypothetical protein
MSFSFGPERLTRDLIEEGYPDAGIVRGSDGHVYVVTQRYEVLHGRFAGRTIGLGVLAPGDYPRTVGSSIHVHSNPILLDQGDTIPGRRNITASALGPEWRYWSHNFGWNGERGTRRLLSQINEIFQHV